VNKIYLQLEYKFSPINRRQIAKLLVAAMILVSSMVLALNYYVHTRRSFVASRCDDEWKGYQIVAGNNSASDGRLKITLNNYHFAEGYVLVNATFQNIGDEQK
jgi:hypothetical protein